MNTITTSAHPAETTDQERELQVADTSWNQQYQRDLITLDRIEFQNECFFDAIGSIVSGRCAA